ncbi:MAG: 30S ribosomal protein S20 [Thermotogae bacterium]|nr:30S ribosomal protein S20 [Thermotogota bacterium]
MPNSKSAIKRVKTNEKRRIRNRIIKSHFKKAVKKVYLAMEQGEREKLKDLLRAALIEIDKAASKGTIHKNQAARRKSRLTLKVNHFLNEK